MRSCATWADVLPAKPASGCQLLAGCWQSLLRAVTVKLLFCMVMSLACSAWRAAPAHQPPGQPCIRTLNPRWCDAPGMLAGKGAGGRARASHLVIAP